MQQFIKKKIGKETINYVVEGKNAWECQMEAQKLSFYDVDKCGLCGSDNIHLAARLAQNKFKYLEIRCHNCRGSLTFGSKQEDPNTYYLRKDNETKKYSWEPFKEISE
jgi:phage FluMu protein Com